MKRTLLAAALSASFLAPAFAAQTPDTSRVQRVSFTSVGAPDNGRTSHELVNQTPPVPLSYRATDAAALQWLQTGVANDLIGTNGQVMYAYGQSRPTITCAPLHVCVINLLPGEHITSLSIGDSVRWLVQPTNAGDRPVVVVKPTQAGLVTNLVVTTDAGRVYYLTLKSDTHDYVPLVGFYDPQQLVINMQQQAAQARAAEKAQAEARKQAVVAPLGDIDPANLDFDFTCKVDNGHDDPSMLPVRVFAGGGHTYVQMPQSMKFTEAPAVFNTSNGNTELMNSRLVHGYYVIDGLPSQFNLTLGVGKDARTVVCRHGQQQDSGFLGASQIGWAR